jgi:hypothetical protein
LEVLVLNLIIKAQLMTFVLSITVMMTAQADQEPEFSDFARNSDGKIEWMSQCRAQKYCTDQNAHLPSARELALLAMSYGAKGLADRKVDNSYYKIWAINIDGTQDEFYFSSEGYRRPKGELGNYYIWSSSFDLNRYYESCPKSAFILYGDTGYIGALALASYGPVRCALDF